MATITDVDEYAKMYLMDYNGDPVRYMVLRLNGVKPGLAFMEALSYKDRTFLMYEAPHEAIFGERTLTRTVLLYRSNSEDLIRVIDYLISNK